VLIGLIAAGQPFKARLFFIAFLVTLVAILILGFWLPYIITIIKLNRSIAKDPLYLEKHKLSTTETGITIESASKTSHRTWPNIHSFGAEGKIINITLADKRVYLLPKRFFASDDQVLDFLGIIQAGIHSPKFALVEWPAAAIPQTSKPPYWLGLLCLIPLVGAMAGIGLLLYGLLKYKDKWLSIIGAAGIAWTIIVYSTLFYAGTHASVFKKGFADIAQMQLNSLVKNIEFYKLAHGRYPDSLGQLVQDDKLAPINDPIQGLKLKRTYFNYEKVGEKYSLFSSGVDGIPNTKDDLFPQLPVTDTGRFGLLQHR
jgi:Type II secretion system (T2SS), protein G